MTRNTAREIATHLAYELSFTDLTLQEFLDQRLSAENFSDLAPECELYDDTPNAKQMDYIRRLLGFVTEKQEEIDGYIERYSHGWKPDRISRTALAVLRCAISEILYMDDIPNAAAINEAVELDKNYDEPDTVSFVNGVLGGFMRGEFPETTETVQE